MRICHVIAVLGPLLLAAGAPVAAAADEVNLYTTREPGLVRPLLDAFTKSTGVRVNTLLIDKGLAERVQAEGPRSPVDLLMTVDIGNLVDLVDKDLTQPVRSEILATSVPENLRDPDGRWYALSLRARVLYASKDLNDVSSFNYESLGDPKWKGKLCIRSGQHPYNTALIAAFIAHHGEQKAEEWLRGVKANLARKPGGGDREVARDIVAGQCEIGIGNSYYVGLMRGGKGGPDQQKWGEGIQVVLPKFQGGGTHVNISGAALAKHAPHREAAIKLLEYLVFDEAQAIYARANFEYPVKNGVESDPVIAGLGALQVDAMPIQDVARSRKAASALVDRLGFDR